MDALALINSIGHLDGIFIKVLHDRLFYSCNSFANTPNLTHIAASLRFKNHHNQSLQFPLFF